MASDVAPENAKREEPSFFFILFLVITIMTSLAVLVSGLSRLEQQGKNLRRAEVVINLHALSEKGVTLGETAAGSVTIRAGGGREVILSPRDAATLGRTLGIACEDGGCRMR